MKTKTAQELLRELGLPLTVTDSARLMVEACEELGARQKVCRGKR